MTAWLRKVILDGWEGYGLNKPRPHRLSFLLVDTPHLAPWKPLLIFAFGEEKEPIICIKAAKRGGPGEKPIEREYEVLRRLHTLFPGALIGQIPRPLFLGEWQEEVVSLQEGLPGECLENSLQGRGRALRQAALHRSLVWLSGFHRLPHAAAARLDGGRLFASLKGEAEALSRHYPSSAGALRAALGNVERLAGGSFPPVPQHGDYCPSNILAGKKSLSVVDWRDFGVIELPMFDLFHLVTCWAMPSGGIHFEPQALPAFVRAYYKRNALSETAARGVREYAAALGYASNYMEALLIAYLLVSAARCQRFEATSGLVPLWLSLLEVTIRHGEESVFGQ